MPRVAIQNFEYETSSRRKEYKIVYRPREHANPIKFLNIDEDLSFPLLNPCCRSWYRMVSRLMAYDRLVSDSSDWIMQV